MENNKIIIYNTAKHIFNIDGIIIPTHKVELTTEIYKKLLKSKSFCTKIDRGIFKILSKLSEAEKKAINKKEEEYGKEVINKPIIQQAKPIIRQVESIVKQQEDKKPNVFEERNKLIARCNELGIQHNKKSSVEELKSMIYNKEKELYDIENSNTDKTNEEQTNEEEIIE